MYFLQNKLNYKQNSNFDMVPTQNLLLSGETRKGNSLNGDMGLGWRGGLEKCNC